MTLEELLEKTKEPSSDKSVVLIKKYDWTDEYAEHGQGLAISISKDKALLLKELAVRQKTFSNLNNFSFGYIEGINICPIYLPDEEDEDSEKLFNDFNELYPVGRDENGFFTELTDQLYNEAIESGYTKIETTRFNEIHFVYTGKHSDLTATISTSAEELLNAINKGLAVTPREIDIRSSVGDLVANEFGYVVKAHEAWNEDIDTPILFDFEEYRQHYNEEVPDSVDILDLGYLSQEIKYESPAEDWREEIKKNFKP